MLIRLPATSDNQCNCFEDNNGFSTPSYLNSYIYTQNIVISRLLTIDHEVREEI